jgi:hypothetical protein
MARSIQLYIEGTKSYSEWRFIGEMYLILLFSKYILLNLVVWIFSNFEIDLIGEFDGGGSFLQGLHWFTGFFMACVFLPILETIFLQAIPILLVSLVSKSISLQIFLSALLFTFMHSSYPGVVLFYIFIAGVIYAWSYKVYQKEGCIAAILITSMIHGLSNFLPFIQSYFMN